MNKEIISDYAANAFNNKQELIALADGKANILLGIVGIILSLFFTLIADKSQIDMIVLLTLAPFMISAIFALLVVIPRMKTESDKSSLLYFQEAIKIHPKKFTKELLKNPESKLLEDYISNTKALSYIVKKKFTYLKYGYVFLAVGLIFKLAFEIMNWI